MHSALRRELRGTQKVFELLRSPSRSKNQISPRAFTQSSYSRDQNKPGKGPSVFASEGHSPSPNFRFLSFKPSQVQSEIESWINKLSEAGKPLHVWDTISERDEKGKWKLLPRVVKDLEEVDQWVKQRGPQSKTPFGIEISKGGIRALPLNELQHGSEAEKYNGIIHGPFVSSSSALDIDKGTQSEEFEVTKETWVDGVTKNLRGQQDKQFLEPNPASEPTHPLANSVRYHGSAAARRQRAQRSKDKSSGYTLPAWFISHNIARRREKQLKAALTPQILTVRHRDTDNSDNDAPRLGSNPASLEQARILQQHSSGTTFRTPEMERSDESNVKVSAEGGNRKPPDAEKDDTPVGSSPPGNTSNTVLISSARDGYFVDEAQHNELMATVRGRLRLPDPDSSESHPGGMKDHMTIHYAAPDGYILLDRLIEDIAKRLDCNLIIIDAQDISNLIIKADVDPQVKADAAALSYDIYSELFKDELAEQDVQNSGDSEENADDEIDIEGETVESPPRGMPFIVGKPITIDLKALFSPNPHRRGSSSRPPKLISDLMGSTSSKTNHTVYSGIVDSILSSIKPSASLPNTKLGTKTLDTKQAEDEQTASKNELSHGSTIVHVKDLRPIQDTSLGGQFLSQLYEQVERRRASGESIMLVGTECSQSKDSAYDLARIKNIQTIEHDELSGTMVMTPAPGVEKHDLSGDRAKRIQIINARHLWLMLQSKNIKLDSFKPGVWTDEFIEQLNAADQMYLEKGLWSLTYVQRLAAILANSDFSKSIHPIADAAAVIEMSDKSKVLWAKAHKRKESENDASETEKSRIAKIRADANPHEKRLLNGVIEPTKINTTFTDIHIPDETITTLQTLTTLSLVRPDAFKYGVLSSDRIPGLLLYGPPGTGKTLAAKAVARESGATMLEVSSADINDMFVGEGEKNVKALFSLAKKLSPCIVFLDEADAMFSTRNSHVQRASQRELINQFLKEWDGMSNDSGSAFLMVATNRPMDLDDAVLRRLPRRVLVDLPTEHDRLKILKIHLRHEQLGEDVNLSEIASKTAFYSGSDLKNLAVSAALAAVREENEMAKSYDGDEAYQYPAKRTLVAHHFEQALEEISASISEDMTSLREIKKFDEQYGDKRGKKRKSPKWGFKTAAEADAVLDTVQVRST